MKKNFRITLPSLWPSRRVVSTLLVCVVYTHVLIRALTILHNFKSTFFEFVYEPGKGSPNNLLYNQSRWKLRRITNKTEISWETVATDAIKNIIFISTQISWEAIATDAIKNQQMITRVHRWPQWEHIFTFYKYDCIWLTIIWETFSSRWTNRLC